jgi:hypothetical protein
VFTEPLSNSDERVTHTDTDRREGFLKYAVKIGSVARIYILSFIKIGSVIQKLIGGFTNTQTAWR